MSVSSGIYNAESRKIPISLKKPGYRESLLEKKKERREREREEERKVDV